MPFRIPQHIRAVFFDAVGTILHPEPSAPSIYADVANRSGLALSPQEVRVRFLEAYRIQETADRETGWATSEQRERERWLTIVTATLRGVPDPEACFRELYEHFAKPAAWRVDPEIASLLAHFQQRGYALGIGSNYDSRLWPVLDGIPELSPLRDRTVISAAVGFRKPGREFFREVVRVANCEAAEVLFVGDDFENDYIGATEAGLAAVLIDDRNHYPEVPEHIAALGELTLPWL